MDRFEDLPTNLRNKIVCDDGRTPGSLSGVSPTPGSLIGAEPACGADPNDRNTCWIWTGTFVPPKTRYKPYTYERIHESYADKSGHNTRERGTPMVRSPELGYATAAHRHLYAIWNDRPIRTVPRLSRCVNDRCVRPHHVRELDPVPERARGRSRAGTPMPEPESLPEPATDAWSALMQHKPYNQLTRVEAQTECGLKPGAITEKMWERYLAWCVENPDDD